MHSPPLYGVEFVFYVALKSQADPNVFQANPTLAAGDVKIAKDDGAPANLNTLPVVDADFTKRVKVTVSATEMQAANVSIIFADVSGAEWCDGIAPIQPIAAIGAGTATTGASTTVIPTSILAPAATATDQFAGRILIFDQDTTTAALRGQGGRIASSTSGGQLTLETADALSNAPASGDKFRIY